MTPMKIFIGWDSREPTAYHVLVNSIMRHASGPVSITPLVQSQLREAGLYTRARDPLESTEFSLTRFLVPYLSAYGDYSLFLDSDMLCRGDVYELLKIARKDELRALWCVQHDYVPATTKKFLDQQQTVYPRKNWSSVMLFRNKFCEKLTPQYVNTASAMELHQLTWAGVEQNIGKLPVTWNHLVGEYDPDPKAKLLHYTIGGPWWRNFQFCDHAQDWFSELDLAFPSLNVPKPEVVGV